MAGSYLTEAITGGDYNNPLLHKILYFLFILVMAVVSIGLAPIPLAAVFHSAKANNILGLFSILDIIELGKAKYKQFMIAFLLCIILWVLYGVALFFASIITMGILCPFILCLLFTTQLHLLAQVYADTFES
ncbi:MAG: hypothetical protein K2X66_08355 [Cyanobacteria bacterium]|nr:hypothetical protein [Cyanobacteriota bacterium]